MSTQEKETVIMGKTVVAESGVTEPSPEGVICRRLQSILWGHAPEIARATAAKLKKHEGLHLEMYPIVEHRRKPVVSKSLIGQEVPGIITVYGALMAHFPADGINKDSDHVKKTFDPIFLEHRWRIHNGFLPSVGLSYSDYRLVVDNHGLRVMITGGQVKFHLDLFRVVTPGKCSVKLEEIWIV